MLTFFSQTEIAKHLTTSVIPAVCQTLLVAIFVFLVWVTDHQALNIPFHSLTFGGGVSSSYCAGPQNVPGYHCLV